MKEKFFDILFLVACGITWIQTMFFYPIGLINENIYKKIIKYFCVKLIIIEHLADSPTITAQTKRILITLF